MKKNTKDLILFLIISIKNIFLTLMFTIVFNVSNVIVFKTMTFTYGDITWEIIIFIGLTLFDFTLYEVFNKN